MPRAWGVSGSVSGRYGEDCGDCYSGGGEGLLQRHCLSSCPGGGERFVAEGEIRVGRGPARSRLPASDFAQRAEGEGCEPIDRLRTGGGFLNRVRWFNSGRGTSQRLGLRASLCRKHVVEPSP